MKNVLLFGYGKMGSSIARGWMIKKINFNVFVIETQPSLRKIANNDGFKAYENIERFKETQKSKILDIIFLAVKPQQMEETVNSFFKLNLIKTVFVSIAAGLSFSWFRNKMNKQVKIVRAMPNLPASIRFGVTGYCKSKNLSEEEDKDVYVLLSAFSKVIYLNNESLIDNVTAISGSGPGYIFYLVEALSQIGVDHGLSIKDAKTLARETLIGSARLIEVSNVDAKILKKNVTSPGGTTEAGLLVLESAINGLYPLLKSTINNALKRAKELNSDGWIYLMNLDNENLEWKLCEAYFSILETSTTSEVSLDEICKASKISLEQANKIVSNNSINNSNFFLKILISKIDSEVLSELKEDLTDDTVSSPHDKFLEGLSLRFEKYLEYKQSLKILSKNSKQKIQIFLNVFKENYIFSSNLLTLIEEEQNCGLKILKSMALNIIFTKCLEIFLKDQNKDIDSVIRYLDKYLSDMEDIGRFVGVIKE